MAADEYLTTTQVADEYPLTVRWLELGRHKGYGPEFVRIGGRKIVYRRAAVEGYLTQRTYRSTAEYPDDSQAA